ncbi:MAG: AI-2E family transporter [Lachnospiraceae bacterium]|nr:AI-2E family transporter [Lachnospiraceae bacterium]
MNLDKQTMRNIRSIILFIAVVFLIVINIKEAYSVIAFLVSIVSPFVWGGAIAFVLNIPLNGIEKRFLKNWKGKYADKFKRPLSIVLSIVFIVCIIVFVIMTVLPQLARTIMELVNKLPIFFQDVIVELEKLFASNQEIIEYLEQFDVSGLDWKSIFGSTVDFLKNGMGDMLTSTMLVTSSIIGGVANIFIGFIFSIYVLTQKEKLGNQGERILRAYLPQRIYNVIMRVLKLLSHNFSSFISGQCMEAVILGSMFIIVLTLFQIPYALLIGVLIGFTSLIPIVGAFIGCGVGAFLILVDSPMQALIFVIIFLVLQQVEGNLIYPHVVGGSVGLPSIWVLAAVTVGGSLMGVMGMLLFIPLVSTAYTLLRDNVNARNGASRKVPGVKEENVVKQETTVTRETKPVNTKQKTTSRKKK